MRKVENSNVVRNAEVIKATIICSAISLILLIQSGAKLGAMFFGLIH